MNPYPLKYRLLASKLMPGPQFNCALTYLLLAASAIFLISSITRTFNFDEWLAIRSGWLTTGDVENNLNFLMPWTWALGIFSRTSEDPEITLISLRLITASLVMRTLWDALNRIAENRSDAIKIFLLCFSSGVYVSHAFEIRYDAAIIILWMLAWNLTTGKISGRNYYWIGAIIALLGLHHTKGAFFATSLSLYLLALKKPDKLEITKIIIAGSATTLAWISIASTTSNIEEQLNLYFQFYEIGKSSNSKAIFESLSERVYQDWVWWTAVAIVIIVGRIFFRGNTNHNQTLWFAITPAVFIALHPRPWNYMLVPIIPFISYIAYENLKKISLWVERKLSLNYSITTIVLTVVILSNASSTVKLTNSSNKNDLHILSLLNYQKNESDSVIDPTGAVYFIEPFDPDWYLDTLFIPLIFNQTWMKKTQFQGKEAATFIVMSYRLQWTNRAVSWLDLNGYTNVCGWLYLRKDDHRVANFQNQCKINASEYSSINNFW